MAIVKPPVATCPKCGNNDWQGPVYVPGGTFHRLDGRDEVTREYLSFTCSECRYKVKTPCADAEPKTVDHPGYGKGLTDQPVDK
jgi:predicted nucleic-acid-binding Zn-ribbon protein